MPNENKIEPEKQMNLDSGKILETYAEDMARAIAGNTEEGLIKKIIHEEEEKESLKKGSSPVARRNRFFLYLGGSLMAAAALVIVLLPALRTRISTLPVPEAAAPLIFLDQSSLLDVASLRKEEIAAEVVAKAEATEVKRDGIEGIYLSAGERVLTLREFLGVLEASLIPDNTLRDEFLIGVWNSADPGEKNLFFLFKYSSFESAFPVLRAWEPKMFSDLHGFFGLPINAETNYLLTKDFKDGIIQNKNARVLYGQDGLPALFYVFADDNSVIIADSPAAAGKVLERLRAGKVKK